ncbi:MAG: uracil-DNA glycosylase [Verrucomicrobiota bacterium]
MTTDPQQLDHMLSHLTNYLQQRKEEGGWKVRADREEVRSLGRVPIPSVVEDVAPAVVAGDQPKTLTGHAEIAARIAQCTLCPLCETRTNTVPGQGARRPEIAFVGEGPGADEDRQGLAFVGKAGQLLTKIIEAMGYTRDEVWIGNIVKCRPPGNRTPLPDEMEACIPYLREQLALLKPKVIVCLGATAVKGLLKTQSGITRLRGNWMSFEGIHVMPTYHPAYLLRNPDGKRDVWDDMKLVLDHLGRKAPPKKKR